MNAWQFCHRWKRLEEMWLCSYDDQKTIDILLEKWRKGARRSQREILGSPNKRLKNLIFI